MTVPTTKKEKIFKGDESYNEDLEKQRYAWFIDEKINSVAKISIKVMRVFAYTQEPCGACSCVHRFVVTAFKEDNTVLSVRGSSSAALSVAGKGIISSHSM